MYTEKELRATSCIIKQIAHINNVPESQVRSDIKEAMNSGRGNLDPAVQARWATFQYSGTEPTVEEFILWASFSEPLRKARKR